MPGGVRSWPAWYVRYHGHAMGEPNLYHVARDAAYLRQLAVEEEFWDRPHLFNTDTDTEIHPAWTRYANERFTGDRKTEWFETIPSYGAFRNGCVLGVGSLRKEAAILRANPALRLTFIDISGKSLKTKEQVLGAQFPGRVAVQQADLNFVELPKNTYDLIVSEHCLHHILNLEYLAAQINDSLMPDGYFFLHDYVGEARFQFADEKKQRFEAAFQDAQRRDAALRSWQLSWPALDNGAYSPFEAVRSDETLGVLRQQLTQVSARPCGALAILILFLTPKARPLILQPNGASWRKRLRVSAARLRRRLRPPGDRRAIERWLSSELLALDEAVSDSGLLRPCRAFGVYRKKTPE